MLSAVEVLWSYDLRRDRNSKRLERVPVIRKCLHYYHRFPLTHSGRKMITALLAARQADAATLPRPPKIFAAREELNGW